MTARQDPTRNQRGQTGASRHFTNAIHRKPNRASKARTWSCLNAAGEVIAYATTRQILTDTFGDDFTIQGPE